MDPEDVELANPPNPADGDAGETAKGYGVWALIVFTVFFIGGIAVALAARARQWFAGQASSATGGEGQLQIAESGVPVG